MSLRVLPTVPEQSNECDCSRRTLLQGIAVVGAGAALTACGGGGGGDDDTGPDAPTDGAGNGGVTMCGANLCIDLNDAANAALAAVGGSKIVVAPSPFGKLIVFQPTQDMFVAMSAVCTHAGCTVGYSKGSNIMQCPCHGSQYKIDGTVMRGPAANPLKTYTAAVDASKTLTITLA